MPISDGVNVFYTEQDLQKARSESYLSGYADGHADGYSEGFGEGYPDGYEDGLKECEER